MTAWRRVQRTVRSLESGQLLVFANPKPTRLLLLDAKHWRYQKRPWTLYVAKDSERGVPVVALLLPRSELRMGYDKIFECFKRHGASIEAVISDWHVSIRASVHDHAPGAVHQRCAAHVLQDICRAIQGKRILKTIYGRELWNQIRQVTLGYQELGVAQQHLARLLLEYPGQKRGLRLLKRALPALYHFTARRDLPIPRTSNQIENLMGFLEQRIKTMRGMKTPRMYLGIVSELFLLKAKRPTKK